MWGEVTMYLGGKVGGGRENAGRVGRADDLRGCFLGCEGRFRLEEGVPRMC